MRRGRSAVFGIAFALAASMLAVPGVAQVAMADVPHDGRVAQERLLDAVHLNMRDGDDVRDGSSAASSVKSFDRARDLLAPGGRIVLESPIIVDGVATLSLAGKGDARVVRGETQTGPMVLMEPGAALTLRDITLDGELAGKNLDSIVIAYEANCELTLEAGAVLQNNGAAGGAFGSAIAGWEGFRLVMNDGAVIRGNTARSAGYGAVMLANGSTFIMNGGLITDNEANRGGGVAIMASSMVMNGGSIEGNRAHDVLGGPVGDGYGAGVYLSSYENISGVEGSSNSIVAGDASLTMNGGSICGNVAESQGGGILAYPMADTGDIKVEMHAGHVDGNVAQKGNGGGIALYDLFDDPVVEFSMDGGTVGKNDSAALGGGLFLFGMGGEQARFSAGRIEGNAAVNGGGVTAYGGSVWNMSGGAITDNEARAGGGVMLYPNGGRGPESALRMTSGAIRGNNAKADKASTKGDGVFQGGLFEISGDAVVSGENDVFLPSARIVDVVASYAGASSDNPMSITSEDHVVEPADATSAGTRLVRYHDAAGGADMAMSAQRHQLFVPSAKMLKVDPTLYIGKSGHPDQLDYMTYISKPASHVVSYRYVGEVPEGADSQLPSESSHVAGEFVGVAAEPVVEGYRFAGWKPVTQGLNVVDGEFEMPDRDVVFEGEWEELPAADPGPEDGGQSDDDLSTDVPQRPPVTDEGEGEVENHGTAGEQGHSAPSVGADVLPHTGDNAAWLYAAPFALGLLALCVSRRVRLESHE